MSHGNTDAAVIVVGGGPVGMLTALGIARTGVPVTILEAQDDIMRSPRAMVYHWPVLENLERLGVIEDVKEAGLLRQDYCFTRHDTGEEIRYGLDCLEGIVKFPYAIHLGQDALVEIVLRAIDRDHLPVQVQWGRRATGITQENGRVTIAADGPNGPETYEAPWVVAADGAGSAIRYQLGIEFAGFTWPERFVATNAYYPFEAHNISQTTFVCDGTYGTIIVKINNDDRGGMWRFTYSEPMSLPEEGILDRMPAYLAAVLPESERFELIAHSPYRMHQRSAVTYRRDNVLLAGDAAHSTNPTGGLGLTTGMLDSFLLSEALAAVVQGRADDDILDRYADERKTVFDGITSPTAIRNKDLIFRGSLPRDYELTWSNLKNAVADEKGLVQRCLATKRLETPSLLGTWG
ncbi:FAD-dependent oxidoreductase [Rhodococcus sp. NPDC057529]|uniref:FAD-dependent oxidoreductase n=1 Tax=Rhodococcus sp. NPDC057529 TaxID=3346158 RepID=UPI0036714232